MKFNYKNLSLILLLITLVFGCKEEEMKYIDPMIDGVSEQVDMEVSSIIGSAWNNALIDLRSKRLKLLTMQKLIETGAYSGENYGLENETAASSRVAESLQKVEFKLDSIWVASIQNQFDAINVNSEGIKQLGQAAYNATALQVDTAFMWIMSENDDDYAPWASNELADLQLSLVPLNNLSSLNDQEVIQFVNDVKSKFAEMQTQYADLASEIANNPHMPKAHKELYASLETPMTEMAGTIENSLSLDTKAAIDAIDWDLSALVYFVANNYTSPVRKPKVWGEISNIMELRWLSEEATESDLNGNWALTADIDAAETHRWNDNSGFKAISKLEGTIDGQFHIISGLKLGPTETKSAFVGFVVGGVVKNIGIVNALCDAAGGQGGLIVGQMNTGTMSNCFATGRLNGRGQDAALIGRPNGGNIVDCFANAEVHQIAGNQHGGVYGVCTGTVTLTNVYSVGWVNATNSHVGAVLGHNAGNTILSGVYYDSSTAGMIGSKMFAELNDQMVDLPTNQWNDLANFPEFSSDTWEIKTVSEIDVNPRPYLKGYNYDVLKDMLPVTP